MKRVIVSRHAAAVEFIAQLLGGQVSRGAGGQPVYVHLAGDDGIEVFAQAEPAVVAGNAVYGNLPLHLAALAACVGAIEFAGPPPRGAEYTLADMVAAGACIRWYAVREVTEPEQED